MSIAIVQGGSKGIGFQLAKLFLQHTDLKVIATARTSANWTESLKANNLENSDRFQFLPMDVTSEVSIKECFDTIQATHGKDSVRYFVNSAGFLKPEKSLAQIDIDNTHQHFNVNVIGPMLSKFWRVSDHNSCEALQQAACESKENREPSRLDQYISKDWFYY